MLFDKFVEDLGEAPSFDRFVKRDVNPVSGRVKRRTLFAPNGAMKEVHRRFREYLRSSKHEKARKRILRYSTACQLGDEILKNVEPHRKNRFIYALDLSNAFPSTGVEKIVQALLAFDAMGIGGAELFPDTTELQSFLEKYFLVDGGLAVGGPASQDIFNIVVGVLIDPKIEAIAKARGFAYTRYLDDLIISSPTPIGERTRWNIRRVIEGAGYKVNLTKTEYCDLHKRSIQITGVMLNKGGRISVPRRFTRMLLGAIHLVEKRGDIDPARIHGLTGVFYMVTGRDPARMNRTELAVHSAYQAFLDNRRGRRSAPKGTSWSNGLDSNPDPNDTSF